MTFSVDVMQNEKRPELPGVVQIFVSFEIQVVTGMGFNFRYIK